MDRCPGGCGDSPNSASLMAIPKKIATDTADTASIIFFVIPLVLWPSLAELTARQYWLFAGLARSGKPLKFQTQTLPAPPDATGSFSIARIPGRLRHEISDSSTASVNSGQRWNSDLSAHLPSIRAS
jgi:hypothetical protein